MEYNEFDKYCKTEDYIITRYKELLRCVKREEGLFLATILKRINNILGADALDYTDVDIAVSHNSQSILDNDLMLYIDIYSDEYEVRVNYDISFDNNIDKELHAMVDEYFKKLHG